MCGWQAACCQCQRGIGELEGTTSCGRCQCRPEWTTQTLVASHTKGRYSALWDRGATRNQWTLVTIAHMQFGLNLGAYRVGLAKHCRAVWCRPTGHCTVGEGDQAPLTALRWTVTLCKSTAARRLVGSQSQ